MKNKNENIIVGSIGCWHLPIAHTLNRYDEQKWVWFGTLTHSRPTSRQTQVANFLTLMDTIGGVNRCFGKRLHWFLRVEGDNEDHNIHLHFLLGGHKVMDGHYHPFTIAEGCTFLVKNWIHGIAKVEPYIPNQGGVGYVTKIQNNINRDDYYELSHALLKNLNEVEVAA